MKGKAKIKYENIYIIFAFVFTIMQVIHHINNDITIYNLFSELLIFILIHTTAYYCIYELRQEYKKASIPTRESID